MSDVVPLVFRAGPTSVARSLAREARRRRAFLTFFDDPVAVLERARRRARRPAAAPRLGVRSSRTATLLGARAKLDGWSDPSGIAVAGRSRSRRRCATYRRRYRDRRSRAAAGFARPRPSVLGTTTPPRRSSARSSGPAATSATASAGSGQSSRRRAWSLPRRAGDARRNRQGFVDDLSADRPSRRRPGSSPSASPRASTRRSAGSSPPRRRRPRTSRACKPHAASLGALTVSRRSSR